MTAMRFSKPRLIRFGEIGAAANTYVAISDHNRSELSVDVESIEKSQRMANGLLRKYVIARKRSFSVSWDDLPNSVTHTVDGYYGADELENWYDAHKAGFILELTYGNGVVETFTVMFDKFSKELKKRGTYDFYSVSLSLEEV